jgi:hypothetical protein
VPGADLKPGERVVELGALAVSAAVISGAASGACAGWIVGQGWMEPVLGAVAGAALGFGLGQLAARHFYRPGEGLVSVIGVGRESLPETLRAGLTGGLLAAVGIAVAAFLIPGAMTQALPILGAAVACGAVIGGGCAGVSSLL